MSKSLFGSRFNTLEGVLASCYFFGGYFFRGGGDLAIILGVDPGSRVLGYGVVETNGSKLRHIEHGVIDVEKLGLMSLRLRAIGARLAELVARVQPDVAVLEKIFLGKNVDSGFKLGHARGVCLYELSKFEVPVFEYEARLIKKGITGNGASSKEQVRLVTFGLLKIQSTARIDASDALSMACYHARNEEIRARFLASKIDPPADLGEPL